MRRVKQVSIGVACAAVVAGILTVTFHADAATTAVAGVPIVMENSGKCLNVAGASTANGAKVIQYTCVATATNDKWKVVPKGNDSDGYGLYQVQAAGSGKCLTVQNASTKNNASLIQYTCTTGGNELWYFDAPDGLPTNRLQSAGSGLCLDVPGRSTANSVNLVQYTCQAGDGTPNERFTFPPAASAAVVHRTLTDPEAPAVLQGGVPAKGGDAPVDYSWVDANHQWFYATDTTPDPYPPSASVKTKKADGGKVDTIKADADNTYGYTGRATAALLNNKRVEFVAHEATAGDVNYMDETTVGTGDYQYYWDIGGDMNAQPTVGVYASGRLAVYAIINGALWYNAEAAGNPQPAIGGWRSLGGTNLTGVPAITANGTTGARIFAATTAGQIETATLTGTTLSDWTNLGGTGLGDPNVVTLNSGLGFLSAKATDGSISYLEQTASGWPATWSTISGVSAAGNPSAAVGSADGKVDVAIRGTDNLIYVAQETAAASGQFGGWVQVSDPTGDPGTVAISDPTAVAYKVTSGQSFAVVFQNADTVNNGPYGIYFPAGTVFNPPAASVSRAAKARSGAVYKSLGKSTASKTVAGKK